MYLYAIRIKDSGKLTAKTGNYFGHKKWYPAAKWAEQRIAKLYQSKIFSEGSLEVVKFELKEVK